jgi:hypothetical protein
LDRAVQLETVRHMMAYSEPGNLFRALSHYGSSQSENYLTEAFVHVLRILGARVPEAFQQVMCRLCGIPTSSFESGDRISLTTQTALPKGRPDIRFAIGDQLVVYVEVKDWSPLAEGQLEEYYEQIQGMHGSRGRLVLLTRSRQSMRETSLDPAEYHHVCWYEVYSWLGSLSMADSLAGHYVSEFAVFLEGRGMGVQKVSWEYENGIRSMLILNNLLETAISEVLPESKIKRTAGWSWRGLYVDDKYFLGCRFDEPTTLVFENNQGTNPTFKTDLHFEEVHFHSLSAGEQLETLSEFLKSAIAEALASSDQPGAP